jgi:2-dehydro-3-deoxygalactonokinase
MRAALLDADGAVLGRTEADQGVQSVAAGGFPAVLEAACAPWFAAHPDLPVVMAGMVGSRNGWVEASYVSCPCSAADLARQRMRVPGVDRDVSIVPGVDVRWPDGAYDVMRGEEVQAFGAGVSDGLVCLPGTHSKWIEMAGGRILRFASFITGELYAAMTASFVGRLASEPEEPAEGLKAGATAATFAGGLSRLLFQARAQVLGGDLSGGAVRPFLSSLIVGQEIVGAASLFGSPRMVHLVAASPQREVYEAALNQRGIAVTVVDPARATLQGMQAITEAGR